MRLMTALVGFGLMLSAHAATAQGSGALDDSPSAAAMVADLVVVRPLSLVATVLGTGFFVVQLPLAAIQLDVETPARKLVLEPARYTFVRELGRID
ncbi:hypothetical protein JN531_008760 [Flagellatimonas centrodinii]|uniref:hypothetical protein n=1 Tax=Flagellatimonas centrodinii TaxID=2806210 RepID=UPI001FF04D24|nr:hypothetical protein [Flagellatimonas centrodinii]ULQ45217.1 hypothetical protein JN531_008760 [Flagellatimonas centrodinii]